MSKTNHRRGFVANRFWMGQRTSAFGIFSNSRKTMTGERVCSGSTVAKESSRGIQRDRAGAKKFVHSRARFRDRMACQKIVREGASSVE